MTCNCPVGAGVYVPGGVRGGLRDCSAGGGLRHPAMGARARALQALCDSPLPRVMETQVQGAHRHCHNPPRGGGDERPKIPGGVLASSAQT
eukprot:6965803-Pyramimonas_sp.AAC.2